MQKPSTFRKVLPLLSIFAVIIIGTLFTAYIQENTSAMYLMMLFMGYFFLVFGGFKIMNLKKFAEAYGMYDVLAMRSRTYALAYPFIELALGILYLIHAGGLERDTFTLVLMGISTYGVWQALQKKEEVPCACLGMVFKVPMTKVTLFENALMFVMAAYMIINHFAPGNIGI